MRNQPYLPLIPVLLVLGGCALDDPVPVDQAPEAPPFAADTTLRSRHHVVGPEREALHLYEELAARLDERGVTPAALRAAADAGDEQAVRELFGYTDTEFDRLHARLVAITGSPESNTTERGGGHGGADLGPPRHVEWLRCKGTWGACFLGAAALAKNVPGKLAIAIYAPGAVACVWQDCKWDGTGPGKWTSQP